MAVNNTDFSTFTQKQLQPINKKDLIEYIVSLKDKKKDDENVLLGGDFKKTRHVT